MKKIIGMAIIVIGWIMAFYVGLYRMIIQPIMNLCIAIDTGNVSAVLVGKMILCFIFAFVVFRLIAWLSTVIGSALVVTSK